MRHRHIDTAQPHQGPPFVVARGDLQEPPQPALQIGPRPHLDNQQPVRYRLARAEYNPISAPIDDRGVIKARPQRLQATGSSLWCERLNRARVRSGITATSPRRVARIALIFDGRRSSREMGSSHALKVISTSTRSGRFLALCRVMTVRKYCIHSTSTGRARTIGIVIFSYRRIHAKIYTPPEFRRV